MKSAKKVGIGLLLGFSLLTCFFLLWTNTAGHRVAHAALHAWQQQKDTVNNTAYDAAALQKALDDIKKPMEQGIDSYTKWDTMRLEAKDHAYNYKTIRTGLVPGNSYLLLVGDAACTVGKANFFSARLYDFTDSQVLASTQLSLQPSHVQAWLVTVPENVKPDKISLLVYAGIAGQTKDIEIVLEDVDIYEWDDLMSVGLYLPDQLTRGGK